MRQSFYYMFIIRIIKLTQRLFNYIFHCQRRQAIYPEVRDWYFYNFGETTPSLWVSYSNTIILTPTKSIASRRPIDTKMRFVSGNFFSSRVCIYNLGKPLLDLFWVLLLLMGSGTDFCWKIRPQWGKWFQSISALLLLFARLEPLLLLLCISTGTFWTIPNPLISDSSSASSSWFRWVLWHPRIFN